MWCGLFQNDVACWIEACYYFFRLPSCKVRYKFCRLSLKEGRESYLGTRISRLRKNTLARTEPWDLPTQPNIVTMSSSLEITCIFLRKCKTVLLSRLVLSLLKEWYVWAADRRCVWVGLIIYSSSDAAVTVWRCIGDQSKSDGQKWIKVGRNEFHFL